MELICCVCGGLFLGELISFVIDRCLGSKKKKLISNNNEIQALNNICRVLENRIKESLCFSQAQPYIEEHKKITCRLHDLEYNMAQPKTKVRVSSQEQDFLNEAFIEIEEELKRNKK